MVAGGTEAYAQGDLGIGVPTSIYVRGHNL